MTIRKTIKIHREPLLKEEINRVPREIRVTLISVCFFILFYSLVFNFEWALNILKPSQPGDYLGIMLVISLLVICLRAFQKLTRPYEIIINEIGISCLDWTFTLLPWERIDYISEGILKFGGDSIPILKITLIEPLKKSVLPYHHSFLVRLSNWSDRGNGAKDLPITLDMRGLNEDVSDVIEFLSINYPKKVLN